MKKVKSYVKRALFFLALIAGFQVANAQNYEKGEVKEIIESQDYIFTAQSMTPTRGGVRYLTSSYDLLVSKDTVQAFLPYFGRAYVAPIYPGGGPLKFTSTDFLYEVSKRKKGGWDILIRPRDIRYGEQLYLTIFDNGSASLRVISNNRQPVTFNGYISKAG